MLRMRSIATMAAMLVVGTLAVVLPATNAAAVDCVTPWNSSAVYTGGMTASHNSHNWRAKWWTQNEMPPGTTGVWEDQGACGGGTPPPSGSCNYPNWTAGTWYNAGAIVRYTNGLYYIAEHGNPGYDPIISTWYWDPYNCSGTPPTTPPPNPGGFVVTEAQFNQMFPGRGRAAGTGLPQQV